jgi:5-methylcytosine-specific restriction endonuclease McrA
VCCDNCSVRVKRKQRAARARTCARCGCAIPTACTGGGERKYCEDCRPIVEKEQKAVLQVTYRSTPEGRADANRRQREYRLTPEGMVADKLTEVRFYLSPKGVIQKARTAANARSPEGKMAGALIRAKYRRTPKGRATLAKGTANRRELSTNPALYGKRVRQLHELKEPCAYPSCTNPLYQPTHQVDHIIALGLGGTDIWENYRPICLKCHGKKTAEDNRKIAALKKQQNPIPESLSSWANSLRQLIQSNNTCIGAGINK